MRKTFTYNGKRYSVQRKTEKELNVAIAEKKLQLKNDAIAESNIRFKEYADRWYSIYKKPYVSDSTQSMYRSAIKIINTYIGNKKLKTITATDLQKIITTEYESGSGKSKIDKITLTLKQIFKQAVADRLVKTDSTTTLKKPQGRENHQRALTKCEEMYLVEFCKQSQYGTWVLCMLYLGLRPSETALIRKRDICDGYIHVRGTKSPKADRYIPIPEALSFDLTGLKANDYIFTTRYKTPLNRQSIKRWWGFFKREMDISLGAPMYRNKITESYVKFTPYTLRHTYGTRMQQSGVPIDVLADLMGHEKIETTRKYYIDDNLESKERYRKNINDAWKAPE